MKNNEQQKPFLNALQANAETTRPSAPFASRQAYSDRRAPDPSSVLRSDRYPIPAFFEYRLRTAK